MVVSVYISKGHDILFICGIPHITPFPHCGFYRLAGGTGRDAFTRTLTQTWRTDDYSLTPVRCRYVCIIPYSIITIITLQMEEGFGDRTPGNTYLHTHAFIISNLHGLKYHISLCNLLAGLLFYLCPLPLYTLAFCAFLTVTFCDTLLYIFVTGTCMPIWQQLGRTGRHFETDREGCT